MKIILSYQKILLMIIKDSLKKQKTNLKKKIKKKMMRFNLVWRIKI